MDSTASAFCLIRRRLSFLNGARGNGQMSAFLCSSTSETEPSTSLTRCVKLASVACSNKNPRTRPPRSARTAALLSLPRDPTPGSARPRAEFSHTARTVRHQQESSHAPERPSAYASLTLEYSGDCSVCSKWIQSRIQMFHSCQR